MFKAMPMAQYLASMALVHMPYRGLCALCVAGIIFISWILDGYIIHILSGAQPIVEKDKNQSIVKAYESALEQCQDTLVRLESARAHIRQDISKTKKNILLCEGDVPSHELRQQIDAQRKELNEVSSSIKEIKKKITCIQNYLVEQ